MQKFLRVRVTARVLRTIDKCGGLDEYLLGEKAGRIKELGMGGWKLRWRIMQTGSVKERFRRQREALGLPPKEDPVVGEVVTKEMVDEEIKRYDEEFMKETGVVDIGEEGEGGVKEGEFMEEKPAMPAKVVL